MKMAIVHIPAQIVIKMNITGFVAIGNGEKCPFCDMIQGKDFDESLEHFREKHNEQFMKALGL